MRLKRFRLRGRLLFLSALTTLVIFVTFNTVVFIIISKLSKEQAEELSKSYAYQYALDGKDNFDYDMGVVKALANSMQYQGNFNEAVRDSIYTGMMLEVLKMNTSYTSVWLSLELKYYQKGFTKDYGRKLIATMRNNDYYEVDVYNRDMESPNVGSDYFNIKADAVPLIAEPYIDPDVGPYLITSLMYPVYQNNAFAGLCGIDIPLTTLETVTREMKLLPGSTAFFVSNAGIILGHSNHDVSGKSLSEFLPALNNKHNLSSKIKNGEPYSFIEKTDSGNYFTTVVPFKVEETVAPWAVYISIPGDVIMARFQKLKIKFVLLSLAGLLLILAIMTLFSQNIERILARYTRILTDIANGNFSSDFDLDEHSEGKIHELSVSVKNLIISLKRTASFASEIEKGNFDADFQVQNENDELGKALMNMRLGLLMAKMKEDESRNNESKESWIADGLAKFASLLQNDSSNLEIFSHELISEIVNYSGANIGGLYLLKSEIDGDKYIELAGSYAFEGEKFSKTRLEAEEGLIGACIKEGKTNYLKELPPNYIAISSSLGSDNPASLLIVPLRTNDQIIGAVEIASFTSFEDYKIQFFEKLAVNIANTYLNIEVQRVTNELLEQSRMQAEQMQIQEEEMRLNMEEMMATQEEMEMKEQQLKLILDELEVEEEEMKRRIEKIRNM